MSGLSANAAIVSAVNPLAVGWQERIILPSPAAGVVATGRTVPGTTWEMLLSLTGRYQADSTAATRRLRIQVLDNYGNAVWWAHLSGGLVANTAANVSAAIGGQMDLNASGRSSSIIPAILIPAGWQFQLNATNAGAADAWSALVMYVLRYPSDAVRVGPGG